MKRILEVPASKLALIAARTIGATSSSFAGVYVSSIQEVSSDLLPADSTYDEEWRELQQKLKKNLLELAKKYCQKEA